jgi:glycosyltransferase involved in cell wall biosynthesis
MHVALNAWFWNQPHTGSGQYVRQLVRHLDLLIADLRLTLVWPQLPGGRPPQDVPPTVQQVAVPTRTGHAGKVWFEQWGFPQACGRISADLAHVPYWGSPLRSPVPVVVTVHDLTTLLVREYRRGLKPRLYNALVSASARGAAHVITDAFSGKLDVMEHLAIPEERVTAIWLGIDEKQFAAQPNLLLDMAIKRQYDLPDFYVLYLGGYEIHKNVLTLLQAYSYVADAMGDDYPLLLAGRKPTVHSERFPDYDSFIARSGLQGKVRWLGYVEEDHKALLYREAMSFVFPTRAEGFGFPPLEAMACGTPVVTTNAGSLPELVGDAAFTVDPDDARGMAGAIIATLVQDNLREELRQKGLRQVQKFGWDATAHETALVYDRVLTG